MLVTDECSGYSYSKFYKNSIPFLKWHVPINPFSKDHSPERFDLITDVLNKSTSKFRSLSYSQAPNGAAIICFTSGLFTHRSAMPHRRYILLMVGACHVIIPKFYAKSAIKAIEQFNVTSFITVPTMMADILVLIRMEETWKGKETVNKILNGGGGLSVELIKKATKVFPKAKIISSYGMTETCSSMTFMTLHDSQRDISCHLISNVPGVVCVGKPAPHIEMKISLNGSDRVGRILTRGPHLMLGYWGHLLKNATNLASDEGWLDTGDIGQMDEYSNVWLVGRSKGRIKSGGENVYPEEYVITKSVYRRLCHQKTTGEEIRRPSVGGWLVVTVGFLDQFGFRIFAGCSELRFQQTSTFSPSTLQ